MITIKIYHKKEEKENNTYQYFYNKDKKEMLSFEGDYLTFEYKYDSESKKIKTIPIAHKSIKNKTNKNDIIKFLSKNNIKYNLLINNDNFISIKTDDVKVTDLLKKHNYKYD